MSENVIEIIQRELPSLVVNNPQIRDWVWHLIHDYAPSRTETENRFDQMLAELRAMRLESERKWEENQRKWEENQKALETMRLDSERRWEENQRKWEENQKALETMRLESERKWEENQRKWEENQKVLETMRLDSERRWEENQKALETMRLDSERKWEENQRKWEENQKVLETMRLESERKWEENQRRWEENQKVLETMHLESERRWEENQEVIRKLIERDNRIDRRIDSTIGAIGARWGVASETSFRNALKAILEESFGVKVERVEYWDEKGEVYDRPDQVELDVIIRNGQVLVCEIKSAASRSDIYTFNRKVLSYEKRIQRQVARKLLISPMVNKEDRKLAKILGIEVYTAPEKVKK